MEICRNKKVLRDRKTYSAHSLAGVPPATGLTGVSPSSKEIVTGQRPGGAPYPREQTPVKALTVLSYYVHGWKLGSPA